MLIEKYNFVTILLRFSQVFTFIPSISVFVRRLHDTNLSGWWFFVGFTVIGLFAILYWLCEKGDNDDNRFGSNPLN